jgi:hypothetical protein
MKILSCPRCQIRYPETLAQCPECHPIQPTLAEKKRFRPLHLFFLCLLIFLGFATMSYDLKLARTGPPAGPVLTQDQQDAQAELQARGLLRLDREQHRVFVSPVLWLSMDAALKETFAVIQAIDCGQLGTSHFVDIFDAQSARKLATWGSSSGFRVY